VLTIFTHVANPSLSDDGIDSCLRLACSPRVLGRISAGLRPENFKVLVNGVDEISFVIVQLIAVYNLLLPILWFTALSIFRSSLGPLVGLRSSYLVD
jgi:hypothetical protein